MSTDEFIIVISDESGERWVMPTSGLQDTDRVTSRRVPHHLAPECLRLSVHRYQLLRSISLEVSCPPLPCMSIVLS